MDQKLHLAVVGHCLLFTLLLGCSSATVARKSETPKVKTIPGEGTFQWEPLTGWIRPRRGNWGPVAKIRSEAQKAFDAGAYADALDGFLALRQNLPSDDPTLAETNFWIGECYFHLGNYEKAVEFYTLVYKKNKPSSDLLNRTFQRVYDIAMDYLHEKADCRFLGIAYSCPGHGIDLLVGDDGLITQYPHLTFADDAIMEIAKYYFDRKEYPEAVPFYERIVREYQDSEWRGLALYQVALCVFKQIRGTDYDQQLILDAERKFRAYLEYNPRGPQAEDARAKLRQIAEMQGERYLRVAKYYLRESQPRAAKIYLRAVLDRYTSSTAAREAREIQRQLEKIDSGG